MSLNKGKYYDAKLTRQLCDGMSDSALKYKGYASDTHNAYGDFDKNELFHGTAATALKTFMVDGTGKMLTEITDIHRQMVDDQTYLISSFEAMVDPSPAARIEYDTLDIINTDFKGYSNTFTGIASDVDSIVNSLNAEFGSYDHFPKPDSKSAKNGFVTICGGEGSGGFFKECQNKFIGFDSEVTTYLKGRDTKDRAINISDRIMSSRASLAGDSQIPRRPSQITVTKTSSLMVGAAMPVGMAPEAIAIGQEFELYLNTLGLNPATIETIMGLLAATLLDGPLPIIDIIVLLILIGIAGWSAYEMAKEFDKTQKRMQEAQEQSNNGGQSDTEEKTGEDTEAGSTTAEEGNVTSGKSRAPKTGEPNSVYEQLNEDGTVRSRTFYDENGRPIRRQDFERPHFDKQTGEYLLPHEHTFSYNSEGLPNGETVGPITDGSTNMPTGN